MLITRTSMMTGVTRTLDLDVTPEQIVLWQQGTLAQHAFWNLSPDDREFLITGTTAEEWARFANDIDEEA